MSDLAYLEEANETSKTDAAAFIADIKQKLAIMQEYNGKMLKLEMEYNEAKKDFEHYKSSVVIPAMQASGIHALEDDNGNLVKLERSYHCSPNKGDADQQKIIEWLKQQNGDFLLKTKAIVEQEALDKLRAAGIPHVEKSDINTQSLKAFFLDWLGLKGGIAKGRMEDIPACAHFTMTQEVVVN